MGTIEEEASLIEQPGGELVGQPGRRVDDGGAVVAHHMDVVVCGQPVRRRAVAEVRVRQQPDLLENFERSIHGGEIDIGRCVSHLIRRRVHEGNHGIHNALALRCHPHSAFSQPGSQQVGLVSMLRRTGVIRRMGMSRRTGHTGLRVTHDGQW